MTEYEKYTKQIKRNGDSLCIYIPADVVKYAGYKEGDTLYIESKKVEKEEVESAE